MQITLTKPHEHAGSLRYPGEVIDLADDLAQWLCAIGSAQAHDLEIRKTSQPTQPTQE